jgi:SAM-dependent methyltransferase
VRNPKLPAANAVTSIGNLEFACPVHKCKLTPVLHCEQCARQYPRVGGVPVLINDENSVFRIADYVGGDTAYGGASDYAGNLDRSSGLRQIYRKFIYRLTEAPVPWRDFDAHAAVQEVQRAHRQARILVIGAGESSFEGDIIYTDVAFGKNVTCIADAHDLPFLSGSFDACVACAVLEHVMDPQRCVSEIERILKPGGYVFAETPFLQPVHMGAYDFTRFTYLGHRRLFRRFDDVRSGIAGGPAASAGQVLRYALISMSDRAAFRRWVRLMALLITYPMRWLDRCTRSTQGAYDSASGFYFFGKMRGDAISDRDMLLKFRGG